jgi:protein SCO1/2
MTRQSMLASAALVAVAACQTGKADRPSTEAAGQAEAGAPAVVLRNRLRGVQLGTPQAKPDFTLTTVGGKPFDFRRDTEGYLTLLFFGYTHCPDVCPVHVANVAKVMKTLPSEVTSRIRFVFVTTDPERDTPDQLGGWLAGFHPDFIGLTGTAEQVRQAQLAAGLMPSEKQLPDSTKPEAYLVGHAAQVIAFTSDGLAHVVYPFGVRQQDWANDLPILAGGWPQ